VSEDNDTPNDRSAREQGKHSIAAFGADLQATRRYPYAFDGLTFDPHNKIGNRTETYYQRYRRYYDENRWYNSHVNAIKESLVEFGLELETDDEAKQETWRAWRSATNFDEVLADLITTQLALGNAYAGIVPAQDLGIDSPDAKGWTLQVLTSEYCYNVGDETGQLKAFYHNRLGAGTYQSFVNMPLPTMSQGPWIMPQDMFYLKYDRLGNDLYGRPLASTAGEAFDDMQVLQGVAIALAKRAAYDLLIFNVDDSHVSGKTSTAGGVSPKQEYFDGVMSNLKDTEQYDPATGKMSILNRIGFRSAWDIDKKIQQGKVEVTALGNKADFGGIVAVIDQTWDQLSMTLRVPQVFMGRKEGSNRAQSVTEFLSYSQFLDARIIDIYRECERKIFPIIGLEGERLVHDSRVPSQELVLAQIADIVGRLPQLRDDEKRPILARLFGVELTGSAAPPKPMLLAPGQTAGQPDPIAAAQDAGSSAEQAKMGSAIAGAGNENTGVFAETKFNSRHLAKLAKPVTVMAPSEEAFRTKWDFQDTHLLAKMRLAFDQLMMALAEEFLAEAGVGKAKMAAASPDELKRLATIKANREAFKTLLDEHDRLIYQASKEQIAALALLPDNFEFKDERGLQRLIAVNELAADRAISDVGAQARQVLVDAVSSGQSVDEAANEVRKVFDDYDTERLVRTELTRAGNAGTLDAYRSIPQYQVVVWMTSMDSLVDPLCRNLEAQYAEGVSIDTAESLGTPPEHPNCRCRWVPKSEFAFVSGGA
jgi:SPP1 gp7 family putative phage head morphogenesis protein